MNALVYLLVAVGLYLLWLPTIRRGLRKLSCARSFGRSTVFEGEDGVMIEVIRNDGPYIIPWLRLESRISPHLQLGNQENLDVNGQMYYSSVFTLMPYQQIRRTHRVKFAHRGIYDLGSATLTAGDPLGPFFAYREQNLSAKVTVYPRLLEEDQLPVLTSLFLGEPTPTQQLIHDPFLIRGIRPYTPGDPVRDIHWPATARTAQAQVRIHDYTTRTRLLVIINGQCEDIQFYKEVSPKLTPVIEHAISMAATLCVNSLRSGQAAGFATNMPLEGLQECTTVLPLEGTSHIEDILTVFAQIRTTCMQKFPIFLKTLEAYSGMDMLVLSCYDSESIQECLAQLRHCGNRVVFHLLEGGRP